MGNSSSKNKPPISIAQSSLNDARASIPRNVWQNCILSRLDTRSVASFAATDRLFYHHAAKVLIQRNNRRALIQLVKKNDLPAVEQFNQLFCLQPYEESFRKDSPFYVAAAIHRNKNMYDALVAKHPDGKSLVTELYYLVLSGVGQRVNGDWHFEATNFVKQHKANQPHLIFAPGPDGISCLQAAAINGADDEMIIHGLLMPLAKDAYGVEIVADQNADNDLEKQWRLRLESLLHNLAEEVRLQVNGQLSAVFDNNWLLASAPFINPYVKALNHFVAGTKNFKSEDWNACDAARQEYTSLQYEWMPLCILASVYFHQHGSNNPGPTFWESGCTPRDFVFSGGESIEFASGRNINNRNTKTIFRDSCEENMANSNIMGQCRNKSGRGLVCESPSYLDYVVLLRRFELGKQKLQLIMEFTMQLEIKSAKRG